MIKIFIILLINTLGFQFFAVKNNAPMKIPVPIFLLLWGEMLINGLARLKNLHAFKVLTAIVNLPSEKSSNSTHVSSLVFGIIKLLNLSNF